MCAFTPRCPLGPKPRTVFKPALLVAVREASRLVAIQRIFVDPATAWYTDKVTLGALGVAAWRGGGLGPTIALAEGVETARAWSILHGLPCWASLGSRRLDLIAIPATVTTLILAGDNDLAGRRAVARSLDAYAADGREVRPDYPVGHKDWAAVLEARRRGGGGGR